MIPDLGNSHFGYASQLGVNVNTAQLGRLRISPDSEDRSATSRGIDTRTEAVPETTLKAQDRDPNAGFVYRVHIRLANAHFIVEGQQRSVAAGMTVQADILTGQRRVMEFFLSPVIKYLNEGLRVR